jgi:serine/threonine-protein kinase PknG
MPCRPAPVAEVTTSVRRPSRDRRGDRGSQWERGYRARTVRTGPPSPTDGVGASGCRSPAHGEHAVDRHSTRAAGSRRGLRPVPARGGVPEALLTRAAALFPQSGRWCPHCDAAVGRSRGGRPGRLRGTCAHCRRPFDLTPDLAPGAVLADRWRVTGLLARGGDWLYTAVGPDGGPVVLARRRDADTVTPALLLGHGEPALVGLRDVVEHPGTVLLVLDPVAGDPAHGPTDPATAAALVLGIAPAVAHLHGLGLLHADLKPGNVLCGPHRPVLVDLGSVRRLDDRVTPVWGTEGFLAPEISPGGAGPSVASEVYALGRTLDVLLGRPVRPQLAPRRSAVAATGLDPVIARATAADPGQRHPDVESFAADLAAAARSGREERSGCPGVGGTAGRGAVHQDDPDHGDLRRDDPRREGPAGPARPTRVPAPRGAFPT